jgi:hypothetical protein
MTTQIIIFSKERPLQLKALLDSFLHYSIDNVSVSILYKESHEISYSNLVKNYNNFNWISETDFENDLYYLLNRDFRYTLFLVDDVIFTRKFSLLKIEEYFSKENNVHGCQLRLGRNIEGAKNLIDALPFLKWEILDTDSHWGYPFDISSGIYKTITIQRIYAELISQNLKIKNPNFFEDYFVKYYQQNPILLKDKFYFSPYFSVCLILTINRVQDEFRNRFDTSDDFSVSTLNNLYFDGYFLNWKKYSEFFNTYPHWNGSQIEYLKITSDYNLSNESFKDIEDVYLNPKEFFNKNKFKFKLIILYNKIMRKIKYTIEIYFPFLNLVYRKVKKSFRN